MAGAASLLPKSSFKVGQDESEASTPIGAERFDIEEHETACTDFFSVVSDIANPEKCRRSYSSILEKVNDYVDDKHGCKLDDKHKFDEPEYDCDYRCNDYDCDFKCHGQHLPSKSTLEEFGDASAYSYDESAYKYDYMYEEAHFPEHPGALLQSEQNLSEIPDILKPVWVLFGLDMWT